MKEPRFRFRARSAVRFLARVLRGLVVILVCGWTTLAIYYSNLPGQTLRALAAAAFGLGIVAAYALLPRRGRTTVYFFGAFVIVYVWWSMIPPSHDRVWAVEYAVLPRVTLEGERVLVHDVRNFDYRTTEDFTVRYEDRTYNLADLDTVDIVLSYWDDNRNIAHSLVTFGFGGTDWLTLSIETRREEAEDYSAIAGFFKQFELIYVLADERDVVRLRTNYRGEDAYLYPLKYTQDQAVGLFRNLVQKVNDLANAPKWYNALENNCTTALIPLTYNVRVEPFRFDIRMLLNGYLDEMGYERGNIPADDSDGLPFEEMRAAHRITDIARLYDGELEFSRKIREHLPERVPR